MTITLLLLALIVAVTLIAWQNTSIFNQASLKPFEISRGRKYHIITSGFVHADWAHLLFNGLALYSFGEYLEQMLQYEYGLSPLAYVAFFLSAVVVANIPSIIRHKENAGYTSVGASGGVAAVMFASVLLQPAQTICFQLFICLPAYVLAPAYLIYSTVQFKRGGDNINHEAHLAGAAYGLIVMTIIDTGLWIKLLSL